MNRKAKNRYKRLVSAKKWIKNYSGSNIVKGYSKKYGVDKLCAVKELRLIGIKISDEYEMQLKQSLEAVRKSRQLRKEEKENELNSIADWNSDDYFAIIIGYTSGGCPYGISHDEMDDLNNNIENEYAVRSSEYNMVSGDEGNVEEEME